MTCAVLALLFTILVLIIINTSCILKTYLHCLKDLNNN